MTAKPHDAKQMTSRGPDPWYSPACPEFIEGVEGLPAFVDGSSCGFSPSGYNTNTQFERFLQAGASSDRSIAGGDKPRPYLTD